MIVARIYKSSGSPNDKVKGSCTIAGYREEDGDANAKGWFAANSFNFGFDAKQQDSDANGSQPRASQPRANAGAGSGSGQNSVQPKSSDKQKSEVFSAISISKEVDSATSYLMFLAMEERKSKKGVDSGIHADIHILSSVDVQQQKRFIYPSLMIHLEGVRVEEWNIEGSGDERPSENVQLKYDRAAISYQKTRDGKTFEAANTSGWDQVKNASWSYTKFSTFQVTPNA
jgi:type VI protein secretion system component Hcp